MLKLTDKQIIRKHDPSLRGRAWIELQIVNKLVEVATNAGYCLEVEEYEDEDEEEYDFRTAVFDLDLAYVEVFNEKGLYIGWIKLVFGNDGYDLISDYSTNLETFLRPVNELADWWGG